MENNGKVIDLKDYLIERNAPKELLDLLTDFIVNKSFTKEEMENLTKLPKNQLLNFIDSYILRGPIK
ncbi:hypothetical protein AT575_08935 [Streptococcus penaeicida]|uniref:Uncharacterized protein n=1 Tax=Streptococcus penaeicida TaxID=1765960 RepID=A0A2N8LAE4_9STRE|nr:hypothetical protein [Streptococcus penaeicida]PND47132.1 hypothetical protein AT575_08935 [Streptococcus penaeicida]